MINPAPFSTVFLRYNRFCQTTQKNIISDTNRYMHNTVKLCSYLRSIPTSTRKKKKQQLSLLLRCRRWVIFPGRRQPSIVTVNELNYCVRNGNRCTLVTINTYYFVAHSCAALLLYHTISLLSTSFLKKFGDPWENRTPVCGVRGRRLSRLTNGP